MPDEVITNTPADPLSLVADAVAPAPAAEFITLAPEVTAESISRVLTSDKPLGFEDMAFEAQGQTPVAAAPEPVLEPAMEAAPFAPIANESGISFTLLARTMAEQEVGREAVAARAAESVRNREITARENAKRLEDGGAPQAEDLSYSERG